MKDESERIDISQKKVYPDLEHLNKFFQKVETWENETNKIFEGHQIQNIFYEDLVSKFDDTIQCLYSFFGVDISKEKIKIKHKKQNPEPLSELIQNYQELKDKF